MIVRLGLKEIAVLSISLKMIYLLMIVAITCGLASLGVSEISRADFSGKIKVALYALVMASAAVVVSISIDQLTTVPR